MSERYIVALEAERLHVAVYVGLDERERRVVHLLAVLVYELYSVVGICVVRCRYHYAAVENILPRDVRNARRCRDVEHIRVGAGRGEPRRYRVFKHIARKTRILADDYARLVIAVAAARYRI